jgi:hypothetical protein
MLRMTHPPYHSAARELLRAWVMGGSVVPVKSKNAGRVIWAIPCCRELKPRCRCEW